MTTEILKPIEKEISTGFVVRRLLPAAQQRGVGPFVFWDHMGPATLERGDELQVRPHPHIGLATVTYLFSGEIMHRDSLGMVQAIRPGEVNWMVAGKGIVHSERTVASATNRGQCIEGIQLWIALPVEYEETDPQFQHEEAHRLPVLRGPEWEARLIIGESMGERAPVSGFSPLFYWEVRMDRGATFELSLKDARAEVGVYPAHGAVRVDNDQVLQYHLWLDRDLNRASLRCVAEEDGSRVLIFGGTPFPEPRFLSWNFVSSKRERIEKAKQDWKNQSFPKVPGETEFIPL